MRRSAFLACLLGTTLLVPGCVGFDDFISNTVTTTTNPNRPLGDSMNMRRVQGLEATADPVLAEPGNVWPRGVERLPTLQDLEPGRSSEPPRAPRPGTQGALPQPDRTAVTGPSNASEPAPTLPDLARAPAAAARYRTVNTPAGTDVVAPNGDGTSTLMRADGSVETVPAAR